MKQKLNADWHAKNKMPERPTLAERIKWHLEHAKHCACREIPAKLLVEMKNRKLVRTKP